ncbi:HMG-box [Backusella circina FSU 941]|nr:HMG-box [Backusella circina FSU 941]
MKPPDIASTSTNSDHQSAISSTEDMPTHIVSPEAIREAQKEETEEALGQSQNMPFSAFPSLTSLKQRLSVQFSPPTAAKKFNIPFSPSTIKNDPYYVNDDDDDDDEENFPKTPQIENELVVEKENNNHRSQEKLKRPPNAYLLFNRDMRRKLLKQSPKMTVAEISKVVGDWWKALPDDQRQYYVKEASLLKEEHLKKYPDFIYTRRSKAELAEAKKLSKLNKRTRDESELGIDSNMYNNSDEEGNDRKLAKKRRNTRKSSSLLNNGQRDPRGRKKKRHKHPYAPKHPMSAYLYYLAEVYPQVSQNFPGSTVGPISKSISRTWHAMSAQERLPWIQKAESDKARYAREMQVYMASNKNSNSSTSPITTATTNNSNLEHLSEELANHKASDDDDDNDTIDEGFEVKEEDELDLHVLTNVIQIGNNTAAV